MKKYRLRAKYLEGTKHLDVITPSSSDMWL